MILCSYHCWRSILICDSNFSCLTLLVLNEFIMSSSSMVSIWVISCMLIWHLLWQLLVANGNHWPLTIIHCTNLSLMLLNCLSIGSNKHDITLVYSSIIWATVRSLLIASPKASTTSIIKSTNWVSTHILIWWSKIE